MLTYNQIIVELDKIESLKKSYVQSERVKKVLGLRVNIVRSWIESMREYADKLPFSRIYYLVNFKADYIEDTLNTILEDK